MKIIFLDIDGVLNSNSWNKQHQLEISDGTLIDQSKIALLSHIVKETNAHIILHSGWKFWFHKDSYEPTRPESQRLVHMLSEFQLKISGFTPDFSTEEIQKTRKFSLIKAKEILSWLENHPEVKSWVVIDDLDLHNESINVHQIKTNSETGLTEADVTKAIQLLNDQPVTEKERELS